MSDLVGVLLVFSVPFLMGFALNDADRKNRNRIAFLCILPAVCLLVLSLFHGSSCLGGECIADGIALMLALLIATISLGYLAGGVLGRFSQAAPEAAAIARRIMRWLAAGAIVVFIAKIAITQSENVARRQVREAAEAQFR